jgi:hypothetical protein
METFFCNEDYKAYLALIAEWFRKFSVLRMGAPSFHVIRNSGACMTFIAKTPPGGPT